MYELEASVIIQRPIEDVFAFVADNENDPQWCVPVIETTRVAGDGPGVGARYTFRSNAGLFKLRGDFEITEFQPHERIAWQGASPLARFTGYYTLHSVDEGTRILIHSEFDNRPLYRLMQGAIRNSQTDAYTRQFQNLKTLLENPS